MRFLLCAILLLMGQFAHAEDARGKATIAQRCPDLFMASLYVSQATGYELLNWCPEVVFSTSSPRAQGRVVDTLLFEREGVGFYPETGVILMPVSLDLSTPEDFSLLLHQVVRVYQQVNSVEQTAPCKSALTGEAYRVQSRYLRDNGMDEMADEALLYAKYRGECKATRSAG